MIMSSKQCFGGGGSSSGAIVNFNSTPQTSQRNLISLFASRRVEEAQELPS